MPATKKVLAAGAAKVAPFTVGIIANPWLEHLLGTGTLIADPIMTTQAAFDISAQFIADSILGRLAGQAENLFADAAMAADVRVVSIFETGLPKQLPHALVADDSATTDQLVARRDAFSGFAARSGERLDVGIAVTASTGRNRATTWFANDNDSSPGDAFTIDGVTLHHRQRVLIPGTTAIHVNERSITALHEFQHAMGSYENGAIVDLYHDGNENINRKTRPVDSPVPVSFATYQGTLHDSDPTRDHLTYPLHSTRFHCALHDTALPAVMDDYTRTAAPLLCQNDTITRQFVIDRIRARMKR